MAKLINLNVKKNIRQNKKLLLQSIGAETIREAQKKLGVMTSYPKDKIYEELKNKYNANIKKEREILKKKNTKAAKITKKAGVIFRKTNPTTNEINNVLMGAAGEHRLIIYDANGNITKDAKLEDYSDYDITEISAALQYLYNENSKDDYFNENEGHTVVIYENEDVEPKELIQHFKHAVVGNCVMRPIIEWFKDRANNITVKKTKITYENLLKKAIELEDKFIDTGLNKENIQEVCNTLGISIEVRLPLLKDCKIIDIKPQGKNKKKVFSFINSAVNHLDPYINLNSKTVSADVIETFETKEEMTALKNKLEAEGKFFQYTKCNSSGEHNTTSILTKDGKYVLQDEYNEMVKEFEKDTGLEFCKLDDFEDENLSKYTLSSVHTLSHIDLKEGVFDEYNKLQYEDTNHIDLKKAYFNTHNCNYYTGNLAKITDFRKTDRFMTENGIYTIDNLVLSPNMKAINDKLPSFKNKGIYPQPVLQFLLDNGCSFDIIEGAWGTTIKFQFPEEFKQKKEGVKGYCRYFGNLLGKFQNDKKRKYLGGTGNMDMYQNIADALNKDKQNETYELMNGEFAVVEHLGYKSNKYHIASYITGYVLINMMEQLLKMELDKVIRVAVDGIYYYGDCEYNAILFDKDPYGKTIPPTNVLWGNDYATHRKEHTYICDAECLDYYRTELRLGAGGTGKTHSIGIDTGNVRMCYVAHSNKLSSTKKNEYGFKRVSVHHHLFQNDPTNMNYKAIRGANILIIDECSMLPNDKKNEIIATYPLHKLIFIGDVGFQLDGVDKIFRRMDHIGFDNVITFTTNYRCKCEKLRLLLLEIRRQMEEFNTIQTNYKNWRIKKLNECRELEKNFTRKNKKESMNKIEEIRKSIIDAMETPDVVSRETIYKWVFDNFKNVDKITDYDVKDMILTYTNHTKDAYTNIYKDLNKWFIKENKNGYYNGEIHYGEKPENSNAEIRHAFTTHSLQGETAPARIFIDINRMTDPKMIYTAISRATRFEDIFIVMTTPE